MQGKFCVAIPSRIVPCSFANIILCRAGTLNSRTVQSYTYIVTLTQIRPKPVPCFDLLRWAVGALYPYPPGLLHCQYTKSTAHDAVLEDSVMNSTLCILALKHGI